MIKYEFRDSIIIELPSGKVMVHEPNGSQPGALLGEFDSTQSAEDFATMRLLDKDHPDWRTQKHANGAPLYSSTTGMLLDEDGKRSIFDDVDL